MSFSDDEDILQDFLVEAGEILEQLSEQLVDLEQRPDDTELLNAIFRGFHTVKGGAGFLQLNAMVDCCHVTENLFDILRNGKRAVTSELMDVVLQALDTVNNQFDAISNREEPPLAEPELIAQLERLVSCEDLTEAAVADSEPAAAAEPAPVAGADTAAAEGDISDTEFEQLLDAISDTDAAAAPAAGGGDSDEITEGEFDALLDQLHGKGKGPATGDKDAPVGTSSETGATPAEAAAGAAAASDSDEITEEEFESLLDQIHGSGRGPGGETPAAAAPGDKPPAAAAPSGEAAPPPAAKAGDDLITEDEFEDLLDQLHGKGKAPANEQDKAAATPPPAAKAPAPSAPAAKKTPPSAPPAKPPAAAAAAATAAPAKQPAARPGREGGQAGAGETTVRVDTQRLDDIMNMVGELVLVRNRLVRLGLSSNDEALGKAVANLDVVTADLQSAVMKTRMQPIKKVFGRFPRVVRDLARNLKKEINLELQGEDTDLDKNLVEALADPLVHLVRNAVDHGIELPATREANGKPRVGTVVLAAEQEGDHILLTITDDGGGMDADKLRGIAVDKGVLDEDAAQRLSDTEAYSLIFAPGFSTKKEISDVSGRGVGMDVVKTKITQLNGSIEIQSKLGEGSRIIIKVPLTLAIMPTLMIMLGEQTFALPLVSVNEIFHMDLTKSNVVDGQECVTIREKAIPIFHLKHWLVNGQFGAAVPEEAHVVIVSVGTQRVGFVVDQLIGQEEVVIKPLGKMLQGTPGMAGATITGDGTIALILDVPSMLQRYADSP
ncbi:chemotaxis protein CheA [Exilibacterium tricleocarpae]|uniref:Chemotaxis protein CheA n=1 Tax=Exilibacterium tricleocarpae TaxID=2591008 RepID=A0A545U3Z7_9GAMM|nr:chemotaxis protein CheA [Exilibacterium tricleocarpae]TQV84192.1 chemotaxis protein CheA [Exilibacterium tricleocarpae]